MANLSSEILDRLPPQSLEAEKWVVGSGLILPESLDQTALIVTPNDFYADANKRIFAALVGMRDAGSKIDLGLLVGNLRASGQFEAAGGAAYLAEVLNSVPHAANAVYYAEIVKERSVRRELIHAATEMLRDALDEGVKAEDVVSAFEQRVQGIKTGDYRTDPVSLESATSDALLHIDKVVSAGTGGGIETGLWELDKQIGGMFPSELIVLAARPGQGKSTLGLQIAFHVAKTPRPVLFVSVEMNRIQIGLKNLCREAGVNIARVRTAQLADSDITTFSETAQLCSVPLYVLDWPQVRPFDIARAARRVKAELVVVDYLQRLKAPDTRMNRYEQVGEISKQLKIITGELNVPLVAIAQLNREAEKGEREGRPKVSQLRESGNIEQDADQVWLLYRPEKKIRGEGQYAGDEWDAELHAAKTRYGNNPRIRLRCNQVSESYTCLVHPQSYNEFDQFGGSNDDF